MDGSTQGLGLTDIDAIRCQKYPGLFLSNATTTTEKIREFLLSYSKFPANQCEHTELELCFYYEIAAGLHDKEPLDGTVVNIGVFRGGATCAMALGMQHNNKRHEPMIAVDSFYDSPGQRYTQYNFNIVRNFLDYMGITKQVCIIACEDTNFFKLFPRKSVRVMLLDTNHSADYVRFQLSYAKDFIVPGGWLLVHDYSHEHPGVIEAVDEFVDLYGSICEPHQLDATIALVFTKG